MTVESRRLLGVRVDATDYRRATSQILEWARDARSCYVCIASVNNIMEARDSHDYRPVMEQAALVTSDGMPLVWLLRALGVRSASRVYGPDLMAMVLAAAAAEHVPVGFYGGTPTILARMIEIAQARFPGLQIAYSEAPPFRPMTPEEDERTVRAIADAGVRVLFVGLGTPKQDRWMHAHQDGVRAVMVGVGAAFDFFVGAKPQAPAWMRRSGLEWTFRLATEPRRLWRRYLKQNPRFVVLALKQLLRPRAT